LPDWNFYGAFSLCVYLLGEEQRSYDSLRGARSAPLGVLMSRKRRVRAAHGRSREAKTH